jgi:hypothetical protein
MTVRSQSIQRVFNFQIASVTGPKADHESRPRKASDAASFREDQQPLCLVALAIPPPDLDQ